MGAKWLILLLTVTVACAAAPRSAPDRWSSVEAVCAPVVIDLVPYAGVSEYYYISLNGQDPSGSYLSHLVDLARSLGRSANVKKRAQLKADQAAQPLLNAVNISCGRLQWETANRVRVSGSGLIAPLPGEAFALGGHGSVFILERRNGAWVIVGREGFWVS
jgi:hypothetical protein